MGTLGTVFSVSLETYITGCDSEKIDDLSPISFNLPPNFSVKKTNNECLLKLEELNTFCEMYLDSTLESLGYDQNEDKTCEYMTNIIRGHFDGECFPDDWTVTKALGHGAYAQAYATKGPDGEMGALKIQYTNRSKHDINREINMAQLFGYYGLSPEFKNHCSFSNEIHYSEMTHVKKLDIIIDEYLQYDLLDDDLKYVSSKVMELISRMEANGFLHGDLHVQNMGLVLNDDGKTAEFYVIDLQKSRLGANPLFDVMSMFAYRWGGHDRFYNIMRENVKSLYGLNVPNEHKNIMEMRWFSMKYTPLSYKHMSNNLGTEKDKKFKESGKCLFFC